MLIVGCRSKGCRFEGHALDCSQPSIFSYFNPIVERVEGIARELDASAKRMTWLGRDWGPRKIEGLQTSWEKKWSPRFSRNGKFPLLERRKKCHHLDNSWLWLHPGAFCGLQQLSSLTRAMFRNGEARLVLTQNPVKEARKGFSLLQCLWNDGRLQKRVFNGADKLYVSLQLYCWAIL